MHEVTKGLFVVVNNARELPSKLTLTSLQGTIRSQSDDVLLQDI